MPVLRETGELENVQQAVHRLRDESVKSGERRGDEIDERDMIPYCVLGGPNIDRNSAVRTFTPPELPYWNRR